MAFELLIDGWSRGVQQYFYAGQGAVRWVTALDQTAVSLLTFTETHRRLQAMQAVAPLLSGPFFTDTLATLVTPSVYTRTETSEGGSGKAPSLDTAVFPNRTESEPTSTSTPTRQTAVSPPPATNTRLTKQVLRRLADQVWIETLPGQKRLLPVEAMASLPHPLSTSAPPQVTAAPAAAATLINLLSQRAARQTPAVAGVATGRSSRRLPTAAQVTPSLAAAPTVPEMPGHKQATVVMEPLDNAVQRAVSAEGDSPQLENRDQVLSTVLRRGYAQPVRSFGAVTATIVPSGAKRQANKGKNGRFVTHHHPNNSAGNGRVLTYQHGSPVTGIGSA